MSKRTALGLLFAGILLLLTAAYVGSALLGAADSVFTAFFAVILCLGAYASSRVVMHYGPRKRRY